jgi:hypothetical protein
MSKNTNLDSEKKKALDLALSAIEKQFGKGAIMRMNPESVVAVPLLSSGIPSVDIALSGKFPGGIPQGRIIEVSANALYNLKEGVSKLPKHDVDAFLKQKLTMFIESLKLA